MGRPATIESPWPRELRGAAAGCAHGLHAAGQGVGAGSAGAIETTVPSIATISPLEMKKSHPRVACASALTAAHPGDPEQGQHRGREDQAPL